MAGRCPSPGLQGGEGSLGREAGAQLPSFCHPHKPCSPPKYLNYMLTAFSRLLPAPGPRPTLAPRFPLGEESLANLPGQWLPLALPGRLVALGVLL